MVPFPIAKVARRRSQPPLLAPAVVAALVGVALPAQADEAPALTVGAFGSLTAGRLVDGSVAGPLGPNPGIECPCTVVDWANRSVYEGNDWQLGPDSKAGLQLRYRPLDSLAFTTQVISRGDAPRPDLQWAYASWEFQPGWQLDVGRKRIPLYYYSEFQDVGTAYPWVSPPSEVYGWESTNYNGGSLRYRSDWQGVDVTASAFGGREKVEDNPYMEVVYNIPTDTRWDDIRGADLELSRDWWTTRVVYLQANTEFDDGFGVWTEDLEAYGLAFNAQHGAWQFLSETGVVARRDEAGGNHLRSRFYSVGAGYQWREHWSAFVNYGNYDEAYTDPAYEVVRFNSTTATLQYRISRHQNLKLQYDYHLDDSFDFMGDADLVRLSWNLNYWSPNLLR